MLRVPNSILWILRFPHSGEDNLTRTARQWAGQEIAQRIRFTNTVRKEQHIERCALADIFLDTVEVSGLHRLNAPKYEYVMIIDYSQCNAHTVAAEYARAFAFGPSFLLLTEMRKCFVEWDAHHHLA